MDTYKKKYHLNVYWNGYRRDEEKRKILYQLETWNNSAIRLEEEEDKKDRSLCYWGSENIRH